ncbi:MAG: hypothetical protein CR978_01065 [Gammaproteobacteria bacterium]|nr:MAG: hypothetical protein CR978_01065 [Gammaproteobacteria bacterium]PIE38386.1 MAG: hypothetical protein CSA53_04335 [Gammaproteobacteria bacterium]
MQSQTGTTRYKGKQSCGIKLVAAIGVLIALAAGLSLTPATSHPHIALGFITFWLAGAIATTGFILFSSRQINTP